MGILVSVKSRRHLSLSQHVVSHPFLLPPNTPPLRTRTEELTAGNLMG